MYYGRIKHWATKNTCKTIWRVILYFIWFSSAWMFVPLSAHAKPGLNDRLVLMWQVQKDVTDEDLQLMKSKGVNLVQSFGLSAWKDAEIKTYLDRMENMAFGVIMSMVAPNFLSREGGNWSFNKNAAASFINRWKNHPAVFAWHTFDEAGASNVRIPASLQEDVYRFIKGIDPKGTVFISFNGTGDAHYQYFSEKTFDLLDLHAYVSDYPNKRQEDLLGSFEKHRTRHYPVIITISAHNRVGQPALPPDSVARQMDFFFGKHRITSNIGFYGWKLGPNIGISQDDILMKQFMKMNLKP